MEFLGRKLRHELKFYIHPREYVMLRNRVSALLPIDGNSGDREGYGIRSLYYDGPQDHALYDKSNGIFSREKYRIRIYNGSDRVIKLERKSKFGDYVCKESASMNRVQYNRLLAGDLEQFQRSGVALMKEFAHAVTSRGFRPVTIVDYTREAYTYDAGEVRITFDKKLSGSVNSIDLFDPAMALTEALEPTRTILEIKYNEFLPDMIRVLAQPSDAIRSTISKYVLCRELGMKHYRR
jgi:hypothetical protein